MATELLIYDCKTGKDGFTGEPMPGDITGFPPPVYDVLGSEAMRVFAREAFGDPFATEIQSHLAAIRAQDQ